MNRSWSKRHAEASPQHEKSQQPQPQLRRMASLTQLFRGSKPVVPAQPEPLPVVEEKSRPRAFYVPTHAASSFARTVSPLSPIDMEEKHHRIDEEDEEQQASGHAGSRSNSSHRGNTTHASTRRRSHRQNTHTAPNYTNSSTSTTNSSSHRSAKKGHEPLPSDYAAFMAEAEASEANQRAMRTRKALRKRDSEREWSNASTAVAHSHSVLGSASGAHRDSAYYSTGSESSASGGAQNRGNWAAPKDTVPPLPNGLKRQPKTLRRRLSEYFKPPQERGVGVMG